MAFQTKMVANGGLGQETYLPDGATPSTLHTLSFISCSTAEEETCSALCVCTTFVL